MGDYVIQMHHGQGVFLGIYLAGGKREVHPCPTQMGEMSDLLRQVRSMLARSGLGPAPPRSRDPVYLRGRGHRCLICTSVRFTAPFVDVSISELCG